MHKIVLSVFLLIGLLFTSLVFAADPIKPPTLKVGVLDIDQLMTKTGFTDRALKKIIKQYEPQGKALDREERALNRDVKKYNAVRNKLKPDEIKQWQHKMNAAKGRLQQKQAALQGKIMAAEELETQKIISGFFTSVTRVAKKNNLALVFFKDVTAYNIAGAEMHDITNQIIKMSLGKKKA